MRILVVLRGWPWPPRTGTCIRYVNVLAGLAKAGVVDLFVIGGSSASSGNPPVPPVGTPVRRVRVVPRPRSGYTGLKRLGWVASSNPAELFGRRYRSVREDFLAWTRGDYNLAWFAKAESYLALSGLVRAPSLVDLDDLEDLKLERRLQAESTVSSAPALTRVFRRARYRIDVRRWRTIQRRVVDGASCVIVCSEVDRERLGVSNAAVIPNGYSLPDWGIKSGRRGSDVGHVILFQGFQLYPPNIDAAHLLAKVIVPWVRQQIDNVQLRIVGRCDARVMQLHDPPRVVVTGEVPTIEPELAGADLVAAPIRFGSGTRLKILEAMAHGVPVVSTSIGVDGLDVRPGQHLLVADDLKDFADSCVAALRDVDLRARLIAEGRRLVEREYRWDTIQERIASLAQQVAEQGAEGNVTSG